MPDTKKPRRQPRRPMRLPSLARCTPPLERGLEIQLALWAQSGDRRAMERLLLAWQPPILAEIGKIGHVRDREDLFQVALLAAMEAIAAFDPRAGDSSVLSLAMTRVRSRLYDNLRSRSFDRRTMAVETERTLQSERSCDGPEAECIEGEERFIAESQMRALLATLPTEQRNVLCARYIWDVPRTACEVGHRLGMHRDRVYRLELRAFSALAAAVESVASPEEIRRILLDLSTDDGRLSRIGRTPNGYIQGPGTTPECACQQP